MVHRRQTSEELVAECRTQWGGVQPHTTTMPTNHEGQQTPTMDTKHRYQLQAPTMYTQP